MHNDDSRARYAEIQRQAENVGHWSAVFKILQFGFYHLKQIPLVSQYFGGKASLTGIVGGYLGKFDWDMVVKVDPKSLVSKEDIQTPAFKLISNSVAGKKRKHAVSEGSNKKSM